MQFVIGSLEAKVFEKQRLESWLREHVELRCDSAYQSTAMV